MIYFVAEVDDRILGGGGISDYIPALQASLTFGVVEKKECRKGYGTAILLARLMFIDPGVDGCQIRLEATEWSADFFSRLGFKWYHQDEDEAGNSFLHGSHIVYPSDRQIFRRILDAGGVTLADEIKSEISAQ